MKTLRLWWCSLWHGDYWVARRVSRAGQLMEVECLVCKGRYLVHRLEGGIIPWPDEAERVFDERPR